MSNKDKWIWGIVGIIIVIGLFWWGQSRNSVVGEPKIGGLFALTGYASFAGEASLDGFLMAIEDSGMGTPSVIEDFQSDVTTVATAATKLATVDNVQVVIGPEWTEFSEVIAPIAKQNNTVFISPWMEGESDILQSSDFYFSATPSQRSQILGMLTYAAENNMKRLVVVYSNNAWSVGYNNIIEDEAAKLGIEIIEEFRINEDQADYRTEISRIKQLAPDAIYTPISTDNDQGVFGKQLKELGVNHPVFTTFSRAESGVYLDRFRSNAIGYLYPALKEHARMAEFREKYKEKFGKEPGAITAATAYDMTTLVLQAIGEGARTGTEIRQYLKKIDGYNGYSNQVTFDKNAQVQSGAVVIKEITSAEPKEIAQYDFE